MGESEISIEPPWESTISLAIVSPSPVPPIAGGLSDYRRVKGLNTLFRAVSGIPGPSSSM